MRTNKNDKIREASRRYRNKAIAITGGLGFIGSTLARHLLEYGADVTIVDSLRPTTGGNMFNVADIKQNLKLVIADINEQETFKKVIKGKDYLFNLAGRTSHIDSMDLPFLDMEDNVQAQLSVLEACRRYNPDVKIVFASTRQIYGKPDYLPVDEKHPIKPVDVNGIHKNAGEGYHLLYSKVYNIDCCILRLTNTYGPRMRIKDARQTFLGLWFRNIIEGKPFEVWGGEQLRDFTYIDDAIHAFILAASHESTKGTVFNLGGQQVINLKSLAEQLTRITDAKHIIKRFPKKRLRIDIGDYYADYTAIKSCLGWEPKTSLMEGIKKTIDYYKTNLEYYI
jgi:nucleoside-diphosphate-sugar epimerase